MSDHSTADARDPQAEAWRGQIDLLSGRIDSMEAEMRRVMRTGSASFAAGTGRSGATSIPGADVTSPLLRMPLPSYLATTLSQAEEALLLRDVAVHAGEDGVARGREEQAAGLACVALTRAAEEFAMPRGVEIHDDHGRFLRGEPDAGAPGVTMDGFRNQELHLLRLVGLSLELAEKHLDEAFDAFRASSVTIRSEQDLRNALRAAAGAACSTHESLVQGRRTAEGERRTAEASRRRRRTLRRVLLAVGGAVIAVANPLALPLLGPFAVGASVALGGGAAGAVADLVED